MKQLLKQLLICCLSLISYSQTCKAQVSDYCDNLKGTRSEVQEAACFEAMMLQSQGFMKIQMLMKSMAPDMRDIIFTKDMNAKYTMGDMAYHVQDKDGAWKGIYRVALELDKNTVFIITTLPFDKATDDDNYAELVVLLLHNGETQLCASGKYLKQKLYNDDNKYLHIVNPEGKEVTLKDTKIKPDISLTFSQNYLLSDITIGAYNFKLN